MQYQNIFWGFHLDAFITQHKHLPFCNLKGNLDNRVMNILEDDVRHHFVKFLLIIKKLDIINSWKVYRKLGQNVLKLRTIGLNVLTLHEIDLNRHWSSKVLCSVSNSWVDFATKSFPLTGTKSFNPFFSIFFYLLLLLFLLNYPLITEMLINSKGLK